MVSDEERFREIMVVLDELYETIKALCDRLEAEAGGEQ